MASVLTQNDGGVDGLGGRKLPVMEFTGCGKRDVELTFYRIPRLPMSRHRVSRICCGERAESSGGRGMLLCADCAELHGLKQGKLKGSANAASQ